ncbi:DNA-binding protein [Pseudomonas sp. PIC25]|uniref:cupin domain-containing protein n=1 Tax=Pseudomonas sp. PIC25 TaxID=1958773 RepID=UPI000BABA070|nr:cupin domain-containing protein [Pseudomonas sp. PIC25]PAU61401.1 DNA-binding protein [Pseudomonas sp. PIC25]
MQNSIPRPECLRFSSDGRTPNSALPVLVYRQLPLQGDLAEAFETLFAAHFWPPRWRSPVYDYHHYHTGAHEALGVARGHARLMLGGERGAEIEVRAGDALVLPAGTGHCQLQASADFLVVGAYPPEQDWDIQRPDERTHDAARARIAETPVPVSDPVTGTQGALVELWR